MLTLTPVLANERNALESLFQLYAYDWSELGPYEVGPDGRFAPYPLDAYFGAPGHHALFVRRDAAQLAGFALVRELAPRSFDMAEFFVLRRHRRHGVGRTAACAVFDRFPGRWQVRERPENVVAITFWRSVIATYTAGRFREEQRDDGTWKGPVQLFGE